VIKIIPAKTAAHLDVITIFGQAVNEGFDGWAVVTPEIPEV